MRKPCIQLKYKGGASPATKTTTKVAIGAAGGFALAEAYRLATTPEQKRRWEGSVKTHHGAAGVAIAVFGALAKCPTVAGVGLGLAVHDIEDAPEWLG